MSTPKQGSAKWVERELIDAAKAVKTGDMSPGQGKAYGDLLREAYAMRMNRAQQIRAGEDVETYIEQDEQRPDLRLIENG